MITVRLLRGLTVALALTALGACAANVGDQEEGMGTAEDALGFDKDNVLTDQVFTDSGALDAAQLQKFFEKTHCGNRSSLADYSENGKSAAEMIAEASAQYHINPIEFLVRLQVERSMLCKPASDYAIKEALSCGCPDGSACASLYAGFGKQISCAASHFRQYLDDIASKGHTVAGWAPNKTKESSDPLPVTPANAATAALYTYTPWVYNGGNQLHYQVWNAIANYLKYQPSGTRPETKPAPSTAPACGKQQNTCTSDTSCNHGVAHSGVVCATGGPERGTCIDACHSDSDCSVEQRCDTSVSPHPQCSGKLPALGSKCTQDSQCTNGVAGSSRVCSSTTHACIVGCHDDADCGSAPAGQTVACDRGLATWQCVYRLELGDACTKDADCNGGIGGTQRICDDTARVCDDACRADFDCDDHSKCVKTKGKGTCEYDPDRQSTEACHAADACPALTFPSGVKVQTKTDAVLTASYQGHLASGETAPKCFLDIDDLVDPDTGKKHEYSTLRVSAHFLFRELVGTEIDQGYGHRVLLEPAAVEALEQFRESAGIAFSPTSGFRSPKHQEDICHSVCHPSANSCAGCAATSRHMHGDAFDVPYEFYSYKYAKMACDSGFHFAYNEAHNHLHMDMNPRYSSCVISFDP